MSRVKWVDIARGIAIIAVVLFHATITINEAGMAWRWRSISDTVDTFRMPLFFFASGLVSVKLLTQPIGTILVRRVAFFVYLYALWFVLRTWYAQYVHTPEKRSWWGEVERMFTHPHSSLWFLYALAIFAIFTWATRRLPAWVPVLVSLGVSLAFSLGMIDFIPQSWTKTGMYAFFFFAGVHLRELALMFGSRVSTPAGASLLILYAGGAIAWSYTSMPSIPGARIALACVAVAAGIALSARLANYRAFDWLAYLGRNTLPIYLLHVPIIVTVTAALISGEASIPRPWVALVVPAMTIAAIALSIGAYWLTRRIPGIYDAPWNRTTSRKRERVGA